MKTFDIITEADARVLPRGETVALAKGGHVTPLAADTLGERRITVVRQHGRPVPPTVPAAEPSPTMDEIRRMAAIIDHTLLRPSATRHDIDVLCREASAFGFAAVCVNPTWVKAAAAQLAGSRVAVCSVAGFPLGAARADVKGDETRRAIDDGAREIDMVINIGALKSGELDEVQRDIEAVTAPCREVGVLSKVIIEAALLTDDEKVTACRLAKTAGADYVKTSTGFGPGGATIADVALMRHVVGSDVGVKAAGGIADLQTLQAMVKAGATRIGTSAGVTIVRQAESAIRRP